MYVCVYNKTMIKRNRSGEYAKWRKKKIKEIGVDGLREIRRNYWKDHLESLSDEQKKEFRLRRRVYEKEQGVKLKKSVLALFGNKCKKCGFGDWRALQIDHINGGGRKDRKKDGYNSRIFYKRVLKNPEGFQLLCANCNWIKRYEKEECVR